MEGKNIAEILKHLEARRKGAWDAEVAARDLGHGTASLIHQARKVAFEEAIRIVDSPERKGG